MINEDTTQDIELEEQDDEVDDQEQEETDVDETEEVAEDEQEGSPGTSESERIAALEAELGKARRLLKKATKPQKEVKEPTSPSVAPAQDVEATVLLANGMDEDLLTQLQKIKQVSGHDSLIKAQNDPLFVAAKELHEKEEKKRANLKPVGKGGKKFVQPKSFTDSKLSEEEHKALWKKRNS